MQLLKTLTGSLLTLLLLATQSTASVLTFEVKNTDFAALENYPEGIGIDQRYGDRVTGPSGIGDGNNIFSYGVGAEGYTPNVTVGYGPFSIFTGGPQLWRYDYGDLDRVLYQGSSGSIAFDYDYLVVELVADPGFEVVLHEFDLAGWFETDYTVDEVAVYNAQLNLFFPNQNKIFSDLSATILGSGPAHTNYSFSTPLVGQTLTIFIDARNLVGDSANIGIDNIRFGQQVASNVAIPEPSSALLWSGMLLVGSLLYPRRKRFADQTKFSH